MPQEWLPAPAGSASNSRRPLSASMPMAASMAVPMAGPVAVAVAM
ncbi:MAG TPA: hypothetical protein PLK19_17935 [Mycobacterium sp.]|nr:hypothetical protein [Mycobacterium sp.]